MAIDLKTHHMMRSRQSPRLSISRAKKKTIIIIIHGRPLLIYPSCPKNPSKRGYKGGEKLLRSSGRDGSEAADRSVQVAISCARSSCLISRTPFLSVLCYNSAALSLSATYAIFFSLSPHLFDRSLCGSFSRLYSLLPSKQN